MTEVRSQKSVVRNQKAAINSREAKCAKSLVCGFCVSVFKLISDLRLLISGFCVLLLALCAPAQGQQVERVPRIGFLILRTASDPFNTLHLGTFRQGLRQLGYVEGENINIEYGYAEGRTERLPELARELVRRKVSIIVTSGPQVTRAAKTATATIPIVMVFDNDPVGNGFVAGLARPGRNITGLSALSTKLGGKQLELLREVVPKVSRVAVIGNSNEPSNSQSLREIELAAKGFGVKLQYLDVLDSKDIETTFRAAIKGRAEALLTLTSPVLAIYSTKIADLALKSRLPAIYFRPEFVKDGGLMSYATSFTDLSRRAATYVDKILKGAKPADLPVEQPTKFELVINLKAAKAIGLMIPDSVLFRADRVIK